MTEGALPAKEKAEEKAEATARVGADWAAAAKQIRDTVDWIAKAFTAVAVALIGTGPLLVRFTEPDPIQATVAVFGAAVGLFGISLIIHWATQVMLPETTDLVELLRARNRPLKQFRQHVESDVGRSVYLDRDIHTVRELVDEMDRTRRVVAQLGRFAAQALAFEAQTPSPDPQTLPPDLRHPAARRSIVAICAGEKARLGHLGACADDLIRQGGYVELRFTFLRARRRMLIGGALTFVGIALYVGMLGVADDKADKDDTATTSAPATAAVEQLTWNDTPEGPRPVAEVRAALGLDGDTCDTVDVVVNGGKGNPGDPWQVTTLRGDRCTAPPRTFSIDNRYAAVTTEPATKYTLETPEPPRPSWPFGVGGIVVGCVLVGAAWWEMNRRRKA